MPNETDRPFLPFSPGPKNKLRQRVRGGGARPRENIAEHGQALLRQIEAFQRTISVQLNDRAPDLPPLPDDHQVIIEAKRFQPEQARSLGLTPIEERENGMLVTVSPDINFPTLVSKAQGYISERTDSGNPRFGGVIAPIEQIRPATREDKAGERLTAWLNSESFHLDQAVWVDVELAGGQIDDGVQNRQEFYDYISKFSVDLPPYAEQVVTATGNYLVETDYSLHRVLLPGRAIVDLLDDSRAHWILSIDLLPDIEDRTVPLPVGADGTLPELPALSPDAPRVVIVDTGLAANHPLFSDQRGRTIVGRQFNFLPDSAEPAGLTDDEIEHGHGTAIASIAAYGSLTSFMLDDRAEKPEPLFWIENAKIALPAAKLQSGLPADWPQFHPSQFPKALIRDVVAAFHHPMPQQCKIFNLSLGNAPHPRHTIYNWAEELDNLSAQRDLLFVVAAGNLRPAEIAHLTQAGGAYPDYLLEPQARLRNPAQAHTALTVGAVTAPPIAPITPFQGETPLAPEGHPAPFSRTGSPPQGLVKPDVVEVGGNLGRSRNELRELPELAVLVANRDFVAGQAEQPFSFHYGAGLAAAKVTHLAGRIQARYPQASANLIRALIVNSAEWPANFVESLQPKPEEPLPVEDREKLLRWCGYGVPQPDRALSSNAHCMVFVAEDEFSWTPEDKRGSGRYPAKVSFFSINLEPDDLYRLPPATQVRVSLTLAYNPPVRKTQRRRYQAIDMRWTLRRREETSEEFQARWMAEAEAPDEEGEEGADISRLRPWPWRLKPVLNPGGRVRRGSLIRDWFDVYAHELPHNLEIVTLAMVAPWYKPADPFNQRFALVVSIEARDQKAPIYDTVRVHSDGTLD
jgi:hypothetical protein